MHQQRRLINCIEVNHFWFQPIKANTFIFILALDILELCLAFLPDNGAIPKQKTGEMTPLINGKDPKQGNGSEKKDGDSAEQTKQNPAAACSFPVFVLFHWFTP